MDEGIHVLYSVWASLIWKSPQPWSPKDESLSLIYSRTRLKCRRVLEHLFRVQSGEVFESIVDWWNRETTVSSCPCIGFFDIVHTTNSCQHPLLMLHLNFSMCLLPMRRMLSILYVKVSYPEFWALLKKVKSKPSTPICKFIFCHPLHPIKVHMTEPMRFYSNFLSNIFVGLKGLLPSRYGVVIYNWSRILSALLGISKHLTSQP